MSYSGAETAKAAREALSAALEALQEQANVPDDVMSVVQNVAQAVGALFEAERASTEPDGKSAVKSAMGMLSQTMALLQDVKSEHPGIDVATEALAGVMGKLFPLSQAKSIAPPEPKEEPAAAEPEPEAAPAPAPAATGPRAKVEANIGATTESNFFVGFSGEISEGGVFLATYDILPKGSPVIALVTLPGGFEFEADGEVIFARDPMDFSMDAEPGIGIRFLTLDPKARELVLRFIRKRPPMFYDE